jgi:hypothetical protein
VLSLGCDVSYIAHSARVRSAFRNCDGFEAIGSLANDDCIAIGPADRPTLRSLREDLRQDRGIGSTRGVSGKQ